MFSAVPPPINRSKASSTPQEAHGLWIAEVTQINDEEIYVKVPRLTADFEYGPVPYRGSVPLLVGNQVWVGFLEGRIDSLIGITEERNPWNKHHDLDPETIDEFDDHVQYLNVPRGTALCDEIVAPVAAAVGIAQGMLSTVPPGGTVATSDHTHELDDLSDVVVTDPADNEVAAYDVSSETWINQTAAEAGLATDDHNHDLDYSDINHNHDLDYSDIDHDHDTSYSPADHTHDLDDLGDVSAASPSDGDVLTYDTVSGWVAEAIPQSVPAGVMMAYGGASAPASWLMCDGSAVSRTTYAALYAAIGTAYGVGDNSTTFNVPDLRQRFPLGKAASGTGSTLGGTGGSIDHAHTIAHAHDFTSNSFTTDGPSVTVTVDSSGVGANPGASAHTHSGAASGTTGPSGTTNSGTNNPPYQVVNYIIKT